MKAKRFTVAGLAALLAACAQGGGPGGIDTAYQTPAAGRAALVLPPGCVLEPDGSGQSCLVAAGEDVVVFAYVDDHTIPFAATFSPPDVMAARRDAEGAEFWVQALKSAWLLDALERRHNQSPVTDTDSDAVAARSLPPGADACIRNDWSGTEADNATWRSREFACIRWIAPADAYQQVEIEVTEYRFEGAADPPVDFGEAADTIFASLRFR